jgi:DNA-binding transcriptional ArsR family regulator
MSSDETSSVIQALAHERRRQIILILGAEGPKGVTELKRRLGISTGSLYHNLSFLSGVVERTPDRKYKLTEKGEELYVMLRDGAFAPRGVERRGLRYLEPVLFPTWLFTLFSEFEPYSFILDVSIITVLLLTSYSSSMGIMFMFPMRFNSSLMAAVVSLISYSFLASLSVLAFGLKNIMRQMLSPSIALLPQIIYQLLYVQILGPLASTMITETLGLLFMGYSAALLGTSIRVSSNTRISHSLLFSFILLYLGSVFAPLVSSFST